MGKLKVVLLAAAAAMLSACSGGSDETLVGGAPVPGGGGAAEVASLTLLTSSPTIRSDGSNDVTITALVRDDNNNVMEGVGVVFTADSGSLAVTQPATTDTNGTLTAMLSIAGDPSLRNITISGLAGGSVQATTTVAVTGLTVTIDGPGSLSTGGQGTYTARVVDNPVGGSGVSNAAVSVASTVGTATLSSPTTNASGEVTLTLTAGSATGTLTATALGASSAPFTVTVSGDSFSFTAPASATEIDLGAEQEIELSWPQGAGLQVSFATSRGSFTNCAGAALAGNTSTMADATTLNPSVCVTASNAGPAVITATNSTNASVQLNVEFVATTPAAIDLQANPGTVATNEESTITAIVRDAAGNLVKNQVVAFTLDDVTGGSLSIAQATTNSQGRAQTVYRASSTTSSVNGVQISASVQGFASVTDSVNLTVAQLGVFISLGTGNEIEEPNTAQYRKEWIVQLTDAQGNGVAGASVTFGVLSERYWDGHREFPLGGDAWTTVVGPPGGCLDEDIFLGDPSKDRNGVLDVGEDNNGNGKLEAGNIAAAVAQIGGGSTLTTDANGFGIIDVYWPQEYAYYLEVTLEARTIVQGTESSRSTTFVLDGSASDFNNENVAPPGPTSAFGTDQLCGTPPPPDGP